MFDVGWTELLVIAIVLIVVVGPKDLPRMLRAFGKTTARMRSMAGEFRNQFDEALKEADLDEVRRTISDVRELNPTKSLRDVMNPLRQVGDEIRASLDDAVKPGSITEATEEDAEVLSSIEASEPAPVAAEPIVANGAATPEPEPTRKRATKSTRPRKPKVSAASTVEPVATTEAVPTKAPRKTTRKTTAKTSTGVTATKSASNGTARKASAAKPKTSTAKAAKPKKPATKAAPKAAAKKTTVAKTHGSPEAGLNGAGNTDNS